MTVYMHQILLALLTAYISYCTAKGHDISTYNTTNVFGARLRKVNYDSITGIRNGTISSLKSLSDSAITKSKKINSKSSTYSRNTVKSNMQQLHTEVDNSKESISAVRSTEKQNLVLPQNLFFDKIEPFWPFSNRTSAFLTENFKLPERTNEYPFNDLPDKFKDTTFFYSHVGPNRFEYRAQFHHGPNEFHQPKNFKPFVHNFPDFPKLTFPPFPSFPEGPNVFHKPNFPPFPDLHQFQYPTIAPPTRRILDTSIEGPPREKPPQQNPYDIPFKPYDAPISDIGTKYPKIFRFNEERINIQEFEKQKKVQVKLNTFDNDVLEPENVQRNHLLILHGGIFTVQEPPLYNRKTLRKRRQRLRNDIHRFTRH